MKNSFTYFAASVIALLFFSNTDFAQAPNLGTTVNFELFTSVGAVTNTGHSNITGDVGSNSGSATGFGNVNGQMHSGDGATGQAATDLLTVYNQLKATTPTFFHAPLLGNGDTLIAGVYSVSGNTTLNGNLYLDAKGNGNALFIFKIEAPLSTSAASKVILINGAKACRVFWKVEGLVSMAAGSVMKGTVIANNAAINMNTGVSLEGRALSTSGAISLNGILGYTPIGCGSAVLTGPAAPNLGTAVCYAIFSADGSVTNSGVTHVKGDVGTNVGLTTGFNPLFVNGHIHPIPDGSTAACASDLLKAYNYLNTLPDDIELLYPAQFGNSLVLTPHTYIMKSAATFTDTVFLNAQGDANAVFVIKISGALSTSTHAQVRLMNGAKATNVYWKVDGAVGINDFTNFAGTLIVNNAAINLATGVNLSGRALTTNGALLTSAITATEPGGCATLPVSWLYFRGTPVHGNVLLEWATTAEINNKYFTVEKSKDGVTFETLTTVNAAAGTDKQEYDYSFTDVQPYNLNYYRISQTDNDGQRSYFNTILVKMDNAALKVLYYVRESYIYVQTSGATPGNGSIVLYSIDGKMMSSQKIVLTNELNTYKIAKPQQTGIYLLHIESNGGNLYNVKVMLQ